MIADKNLQYISSQLGTSLIKDPAGFLDAHKQPPVTSVRLHPVKYSRGWIPQADPVPWASNAYYLDQRPVFTLDPLFHTGAYYVQEASSMFLDTAVRQLFPDTESVHVLDLCAAPGGKSTLLASWLNGNGLLVSNELIRSRVPVLTDNSAKWGYSNHWVVSDDPVVFGQVPGFFDLMVVDAPCSGSGLFRKKTDYLEEWSEELVRHCAARQKRILADAWESLKEGGILVYATCSFSLEENEQIADWLAGNYQAEAVSLQFPDEWGIVRTESAEKQIPGYRFFPHLLKGEGFFMTVLRKKESVSTKKQRKSTRTSDILPYKAAWPWLMNESQDFRLFAKADQLMAIPGKLLESFKILEKQLYGWKWGISLGSIKGKEIIPAHEASLSLDIRTDLDHLDLTEEQAISYLRRADFSPDVSGKGWYLMRYNGLNLGWAKLLQNRINNYFPKNLRVRM